jgi:hypothetical protein
VLKPELVDFMRIHEIKKDLLIKRQSVYSQKLCLMGYRTSLATYLESKLIEEIKINETQILNYVYRIGQQIETLEDTERDLLFELDLLKVINHDHYCSLAELHKETNSNSNHNKEISTTISVDLNSYEFFEWTKSYEFKTNFKAFFRNYLMKRENEYLLRVNKELKSKVNK